jgi:hypothetical protein
MIQMINMMIAANAAAYNPAQFAAAAATSAPFSNLPKAAKAPTIENYNGSVKLLCPWLNRTRGILIMLGFDLNQPFTVVYAACFLTGPAQSWYNSEADRAKQYNPPPPTAETPGLTTPWSLAIFLLPVAALLPALKHPNVDDASQPPDVPQLPIPPPPPEFPSSLLKSELTLWPTMDASDAARRTLVTPPSTALAPYPTTSTVPSHLPPALAGPRPQSQKTREWRGSGPCTR